MRGSHSTEILGQSDRVGSKSPTFDLFSPVAPQPYDLAKKIQLTLMEVPYALSNEPKMIIVSAPKCPKGGAKTQNSRFPSTIALLLKKVCYKVSLCENCQRQCCRAFIGLTVHAKIIGGGRPLLPENLGQIDCVGAKPPIFDLFSLVAPNKCLSLKTVSKKL